MSSSECRILILNQEALKYGLSPEDLGLALNLSCLPSKVRDLILLGNRGEYHDHSETNVAVCVAMFCVGYGLDEMWMVMTDPANGISKTFFEEYGERAEAQLEQIISKACEVAEWRGGK